MIKKKKKTLPFLSNILIEYSSIWNNEPQFGTLYLIYAQSSIIDFFLFLILNFVGVPSRLKKEVLGICLFIDSWNNM